VTSLVLYRRMVFGSGLASEASPWSMYFQSVSPDWLYATPSPHRRSWHWPSCAPPSDGVGQVVGPGAWREPHQVRLEADA